MFIALGFGIGSIFFGILNVLAHNQMIGLLDFISGFVALIIFLILYFVGR